MPNEDLKYKNDFDHREIYQKLPPQEKDFVYERAVRQKENLEYRLAFRLEQRRLKQEKTSEKSRPGLSRAEKSFHLTSIFHQARILGERFESAELTSKEIGERDFRAALVLHNNHSGERVALGGGALEQSANIETQKVGEILQVFGKAKISQTENKRQIKIALPENALVSTDTYRELLEKFYPNDERDNEKYKFANFAEKAVEDARTKGQDAALANVGDELKQNVYVAESAPTAVFSIEQSIAEDVSKIAEMQREARRAQRENANLLAKYAARAAAKSENRNSPALSAAEQKAIVRAALLVETNGANQVSGKTQDEFFRAAQREISIGDFQKFAANELIINESLTAIKNQFSEISAKQTVLEENKFRTAETRSADKPPAVAAEDAQRFDENRMLTEVARTNFESGKISDSENKTIAGSIGEQEKSEIRNESMNRVRHRLETESRDISSERTADTKPFSLRLYEAEIARAEKELRTKNLGAKILAGVDYSESELTLNLDKIFSADEREQIRLEAAETAKTRLEPKELDTDHRKIPAEASGQAIATFKQLEQAHNVYQLSGDAAKINEAFSKFDREARALNQIRQDYSRAERLAVLRETVKTDIADLLRKNPDIKGNALVEQTNKILTENLSKAGSAFAGEAAQEKAISLSRVIVEKIEASQSKTATATKQMIQTSPQIESRELKTEVAALKDARIEKQSFVFTR